MSAENPVSPKLIAAASGAGAGVIVSGFVVWLIGAWFYNVGFSALNADDAVAAVPAQVVGIVGLLIVVISAAIPGYTVIDPARSQPGAVEPEITDEPAVEPDETPDVEDPETDAVVSGDGTVLNYNPQV